MGTIKYCQIQKEIQCGEKLKHLKESKYENNSKKQKHYDYCCNITGI